MYKFNFILIFAFLISYGIRAQQMQSEYLPLGSKYIKYNSTNTTVQNLTTNGVSNAPSKFDVNGNYNTLWGEYVAHHYIGQQPEYCQAIAYDYLSDCTPDDILFYIVDNNIYNKDGVSIDETYSNLDYPLCLFDSDPYNSPYSVVNELNSDYKKAGLSYDYFSIPIQTFSPNVKEILANDILVIPDPQNCYQYFLIYTILTEGYGGSRHTENVFYRKLIYHDKNHITMSNIVFLAFSHDMSINLSASEYRNNTRDFLIFVKKDDDNHLIEAYTTTTLNNFLNNPVLNSSPNIDYVINWDASLAHTTLIPDDHGLCSEMECKTIIENGQKYYYLTFFNQNIGSINNMYKKGVTFFKLNYNNLSVVQNECIETPLQNINYDMSGGEFSPDGKTFYFTYEGQTGLNYISTDFLEQGTAPPAFSTLNIPNPENYGHSHIELSRDENLYLISSNGSVSKLSNPNNPDVNNWSTNVANITGIVPTTTPTLPNDYNAPQYIFTNQIDGEHYANYAQAHPLSATCCAEHIKEFEYDDYYNPITITSNVVWDGTNNPFNNTNTINLCHDVIIKDGGSLTINNLTVRFKEGVGIKVNEQGTFLPNNSLTSLHVNNSLLTTHNQNCCGQQYSYMWKGITVIGNNDGQVNGTQAGVYLSNSTIENAYTAINSKFGGIVVTVGSTFRNNQYGIYVQWANNKNSTYNRVHGCTFITDGPLNNPGITPVYYVNLSGIDKFKFINNTFTDNYNDKMINGIYANYCNNVLIYNMGTNSPNTFQNLKYGVYAAQCNAIQIKNANFIDNTRGARLFNIPNAVVLNNDFDVAQGIFGTSGVYGLSIESSTGYQIQNNIFHDGGAGLYVINSGVNENEVRRNQFYNLQNNSNQTGIIAQEINGSEPNELLCDKNYGLKILCNKFTNNDYNIANINGVIKIKQYTTNSNKPANNWFSQHQESNYQGFDFYVENPIYSTEIEYSQNGENEADELRLDWYNTIPNYITYGDPQDYYTYPNGVEIEQEYVDNPHTWEEVCPDEYPTGGGINPFDPIVIHTITKVDNDKQEAADKKDELDAKIDGGNTQALQSEVDNLTNYNYFQTCIDLLEVGPYLSDGVLTSFMDNQIYRPVAKTIVLIANSPLPMAAKQKIDDVNIPPFFKWYLKQLQNGTYQREQDEMEIGSLLSGSDKLLNKTIAFALSNDTVPEKLDSIITWLEDKQTLDSYYRLIPLYIKKGQYSNATTALEALLAEANTIGGTVQENAENYNTIKQIDLQIIQNPDTAKYIIPANIKQLETIAEGEGKQAGIARYMLYNYNKEQYIKYKQKYLLPNTNKSLALQQPNKPSQTYTGKKPDAMISVYPNPTNGELNVEYINFKNAKTINIYDLKGSIVMSFNANKDFGFNTIDVSSLQKGTYLIGFGKKQTTKFIVK